MFLVKELKVGDLVEVMADLTGGYTDSKNKFHEVKIMKGTIGQLTRIEPTLETVIFWVEFPKSNGDKDAYPLLPHTIKKHTD